MPPACLDFKLIYHPSLKSKSRTHHVQKTDKNLVSGKTDKYFFAGKTDIANLGPFFFFALQLLQYEGAWIAELVLVRHRHGGPAQAY